TCLEDGRGFTVATLNLDHIVKLRHDAGFRAAYGAHSHVVADGNPIVWLRKMVNRPVELVPGSELIDPICALAARVGAPVAFLGSTEETLALAAERLGATYPGLNVVARIVPPFGFDPNGAEVADYAAQLRDSGAQVCFLALGAPKQEIVATRAAQIAPACGFVSIGAGLDFIAGSQTRAPKWVRAIAMEWFWRMASNPKRLAK
ncbi:WecB/TagA/CpsF family glycosyltransferase, partial [Escherichia coli]|nr:WecB/TagA/CpsF family glycosyltransferase [Escherichia coli]